MRTIRDFDKMHDYQLYLADRVVKKLFPAKPKKKRKRKPGLLLAVDMGLGKTVAMLTAVRQLLDEGMIFKVLIIAPLRVAEETWPEEIRSWSHTRCLSFSVVTGTAAERAGALKKEAEIYIINRENVPWLYDLLGDAGWDFDFLVYDESSRLKAGKKFTAGSKNRPNKKKTKAIRSEFGTLALVRRFFKGVVELSGTPAPNGVIDMWGQFYIIDQGARLGASKKAFLDRWFDKNSYSYAVTPKDHAIEEIPRRVKDIMIGLRAEDYIEMPPRIDNRIYVELPPKIMGRYKQFERDLVSIDYDVEAVSRGVLTNKLLQFANGSMYRSLEDEDEINEKKRREVVHIHDLKMAALESVIEEAAGQSVLIAYSFKFDIARIKKRFPKVVLFDEEKNFIKKWNAGKIHLALAHPASIGHGLNLQFGGHISCWYGLTWSLELWDQFNKRLPRPGQPHPFVTNHIIMARGTADEDVYAATQIKGATQDTITNAVRVRLRQLTKQQRR